MSIFLPADLPNDPPKDQLLMLWSLVVTGQRMTAMFSFATAAPPAANGYVPSSSTTRQHMDLDFDDDDLQQDALKYTVPGEEIADAKLWMR